MSRFRFSRSHPGDHEAWFRVGSVDVTTSWLVTGVGVLSFVLYAISPRLLEPLALDPWAVVHQGHLWRVVTWPLVNPPSIWSALAIFFFWYFGTQVERHHLGRDRFARYLAWLTLALGLLAVALSFLTDFNSPWLAGLGTLELVVVLLFIAENPHVRFFFNIPGWVIGLVLVAIPILQLLAYRQWIELLNLVLGLVLAALLASRYGMLRELSFVPRLDRGVRRERRRRAARPSTSQHPSHGTVTEGPWLSAGRAGSDQHRLDALLDKIGESGLDSLSGKEREELLELRRRLRGGD